MSHPERGAELNRRIDQATHFLETHLERTLDVGVVLGSGLGGLHEYLEPMSTLDYLEIPEWPKSSTKVEGHAGMFHAGAIGNITVGIMAGRFHLYQGHSIDEVVFPIRVLARLGIKVLIVTNAAGGVDPLHGPGSMMVIRDHINFQGISPLEGEQPLGSPERFVDMTRAYDPELSERLITVGADQGLRLCQGVYAAMRGPQYETPAEVRMLRALGVSAVGMSTAPEVIVARHLGIRVVGISSITNAAAGVTDRKLSHKEVVEVGAANGRFLGRLLHGFIHLMGPNDLEELRGAKEPSGPEKTETKSGI